MSEALIFGVDPVLAPTEAQVVGYAIMCNIELRTDERELVVARPLYEWPLLKRMYQARGGSAKIDNSWLVNPKSGNDAYARTVPLTRHTLRQEMARLQSAFRLPSSKGEPRKLFDEVYGVGSLNRFAEVVASQAKAYKKVVAELKVLNAERKNKCLGPESLRLEDWTKIASIGDPVQQGVDHLEIVTMEDTEVDGLSPVVDDIDPSIGLQLELTEMGVSPDVAMAIADLHVKGRVAVETLKQVPTLVGKKEEIRGAMVAYQKWLDKKATGT